MTGNQALGYGFALPLIVMLGTLWFTSDMLHSMYKAATGYHIGELREMKKECEKSLPRDKVCKAEINFVIEE